MDKRIGFGGLVAELDSRAHDISGGGRGVDKVQREVTIPEAITIADLANRMSERGAAVVKYLFQQGVCLRTF